MCSEALTLVRAPIDPATGKPYETCSYALFPGLALAESEPELVVLLYDSILHLHQDTAMFLYYGREGADPLLNRKWQQRFLVRWRELSKPTMIVISPEDRRFFRGHLGEIKTVSIYDELLSGSISGGCNHELYRLDEPEDYGFDEPVRQLADMMGAVIYDPDAGDISAEDADRIPLLTSSIDRRNQLKREGREAVHVLELVYGMGRSNAHLAHTHAEGHDHDHNQPPQVRNVALGPEEKNAIEALFDNTAKRQNLQEVRDTLLQFFWGES